MVSIKLTSSVGDTISEFTLIDKVSIITGKSGTGKTYLFNTFDEAIKSTEQNMSGMRISCIESVKGKKSKEVECQCINTISQLDNSLTNAYSKIDSRFLLITDEDIADELLNRSNTKLKHRLLSSKNVYLLILTRSVKGLNYCGINSLYRLSSEVYLEGLYTYFEVEPMIVFTKTENEGSSFEFDTILIEDSLSGYLFFLEYFDKEVISTRGNDRFADILCELCEKGHRVLCFLDFDQGSEVLISILSKLDNKYRSRVKFIEYECFEQLICESTLFRNMIPDDKSDLYLDKLTNFESYIDCSVAHRGKYFFNLQKELLPFISKNDSSCLLYECCMLGTICKCYTDDAKVREVIPEVSRFSSLVNYVEKSRLEGKHELSSETREVVKFICGTGDMGERAALSLWDNSLVKVDILKGKKQFISAKQCYIEIIGEQIVKCNYAISLRRKLLDKSKSDYTDRDRDRLTRKIKSNEARLARLELRQMELKYNSL